MEKLWMFVIKYVHFFWNQMIVSIWKLNIFEHLPNWNHNGQVKVSGCIYSYTSPAWSGITMLLVQHYIKTLILFTHIVFNKEISSNHLSRFALKNVHVFFLSLDTLLNCWLLVFINCTVYFGRNFYRFVQIVRTFNEIRFMLYPKQSNVILPLCIVDHIGTSVLRYLGSN